MEGYRQDWAKIPGAGVPLAVVRPLTTEHVQAAVRWAAATNTPIVPRGAGTGVSGGATAVNGGIVISTERMREITVDPITRTAVAQPGLLNAEVKKAVAAHGLWYPPDPSSFEICSIGGNVATNAGGLCCVKYGVTTDYILGLVVVLADGRAVRLGGPHLKDSAGLSLTKLFVGSEGTLGIVTEITVRLIPAQLVQATVVATFGSLADACQAVLDITMKMRPSMLEFMDKATINAVEDDMRMDLDRTAEAMLVARSDAPGDYAAVEAETMAEIFRNRNATEVFVTDDPDEGEAFTAARRSAFHAMGKKGYVLFEDVGVAIPKLGDLVVGVEKIGLDHNVRVATVAHAGDGNTHPMIVFDETNAAEVERAHLAFGAIMDLAIGLGGTITGEHGVGRLKKAWLPNQLGEDVMDLTRRIKNALDPQGILNPGSVV
ncbi:FAD-binding oxidoreductase [Smaragdicoccus niigatensis]|uniref:FAD-binding oxidoreductase n=2 Tax=Smaragdicoccus niigatensis TaxID=359359 RepID=UPI0009DC12E7|nr:FAD-linked oxidase C-terminal domain-containing protein [Smaragdicoccus niigatensis]